MQANVTTIENGSAGTVELSDAIFGLEPRQDLIQRMGVACARPAQAVIEIGMKAMKKWLELRKNE